LRKKTFSACLTYLKSKQLKGEKASNIIYNSIQLQDYLNPCSNIKLEDQRAMFSLRSRMNETKTNFSRNNKLKNEYCIKDCGKELDNEHMTWCSKLNTDNEYKYIQLLNGTLNEKIEAFKQINLNEERRKENSITL
jgi:hypothetical protein